MKTKRYRIVRDNYAGYEVQGWRIWFPFWIQLSQGGSFGVNTSSDIEEAKKLGEQFLARRVVYRSDRPTQEAKS